jgi:hypothetical protein
MIRRSSASPSSGALCPEAGSSRHSRTLRGKKSAPGITPSRSRSRSERMSTSTAPSRTPAAASLGSSRSSRRRAASRRSLIVVRRPAMFQPTISPFRGRLPLRYEDSVERPARPAAARLRRDGVCCLPPGIDGFGELGERNAQRLRDLRDGSPRRVGLTALDPRVCGHGESCLMSDRLLGEPAALAQLTKSRERVADRAMTGAPLPSKVLAPMRARKSAVPSGCRVAPLESSWRRENRLVAGGSWMARPGLEPGTPRFSVVCSTN